MSKEDAGQVRQRIVPHYSHLYLGNTKLVEVTTIPKHYLGIRPSITRLSTSYYSTGTRNIPYELYLPRSHNNDCRVLRLQGRMTSQSLSSYHSSI